MLDIIDHNNIREIRLSRPPVNALNPELVDRLTQSIHEAGKTFGAVVLSGQQGLFSAGLDVVELMQLDRQGMIDFWSSFMRLLGTIACSPVPVAAAITGHSPAGGAVMCLVADYRVMSQGDYKIGLNETRVGLVIPGVLHEALARLTGPRNAEQMVVAGALVSPERAKEIGLVDTVMAGYDETIQHAVEWCEKLLALPGHAMLGNRALARAHFEQAFSEDALSGVEIFVENWFSDKTRQVLGDLIAQLKNKK